ncbi:MAG: rhodanese-like domain-containing protein [Ruminococcaceae bacterium]|nr:rhodanese-like domain-containing protein [Oscillospiraceae bacterium]
MIFKGIKGLIFLIIVSLTLFSSCSGTENNETTNSTTEATINNTLGYEQISGEQAKHLMDTEKDYIIIDARTEEEFNEGHIEGAILIPEYEIGERAEKELLNKDQLVLVYCRSGRRSKIAAQALVDLGYTNVKEFGGIIDWQYEIVK